MSKHKNENTHGRHLLRFCKKISRNVLFSDVRNDSEPNTNYVRVLDPRAQEISFVRTSCHKKEALYVSCDGLGEFCILRNKDVLNSFLPNRMWCTISSFTKES